MNRSKKRRSGPLELIIHNRVSSLMVSNQLLHKLYKYNAKTNTNTNEMQIKKLDLNQSRNTKNNERKYFICVSVFFLMGDVQSSTFKQSVNCAITNAKANI